MPLQYFCNRPCTTFLLQFKFYFDGGPSYSSHLSHDNTAIELKRKAPRAHTFLEVVKKRYGPAGHITLMCYSLIFQIFTTVNLLVGGSTVYSSMTGMNRDAACFLFPIGVLIYTLFGGTFHPRTLPYPVPRFWVFSTRVVLDVLSGPTFIS